MRESLRDENSDQKNRNVKENQQITSSVESLQSVKDNQNSQKTTYQVDNQVASTHAAEAEITPAEDDQNAKHFVLVKELEQKMINQADQSVADQAANQAELLTNNQLISEKHNSLILNYPRSKIRHDYKQLHRRGFVKSAKIESMRHDLITSKTFEQIINEPQAKE